MKKPVYRINLTRTVSLQKAISTIARQLGRKRTAFDIFCKKLATGEITQADLEKLVETEL